MKKSDTSVMTDASSQVNQSTSKSNGSSKVVKKEVKQRRSHSTPSFKVSYSIAPSPKVVATNPYKNVQSKALSPTKSFNEKLSSRPPRLSLDSKVLLKRKTLFSVNHDETWPDTSAVHYKKDKVLYKIFLAEEELKKLNEKQEKIVKQIKVEKKEKKQTPKKSEVELSEVEQKLNKILKEKMDQIANLKNKIQQEQFKVIGKHMPPSDSVKKTSVIRRSKSYSPVPRHRYHMPTESVASQPCDMVARNRTNGEYLVEILRNNKSERPPAVVASTKRGKTAPFFPFGNSNGRKLTPRVIKIPTATSSEDIGPASSKVKEDQQSSLDGISKSALDELRAFRMPPVYILHICSMLMHLLSNKIEKKASLKWDRIRSRLNINDLKSLDIANLDDKVVKYVHNTLKSWGVGVEYITKISRAGGSLYQWLLTVITIHGANESNRANKKVEAQSPPSEPSTVEEEDDDFVSALTESQKTKYYVALQNIKKLTKIDIDEIKSFNNPPVLTQKVCNHAVLLLGWKNPAGCNKSPSFTESKNYINWDKFTRLNKDIIHMDRLKAVRMLSRLYKSFDLEEHDIAFNISLSTAHLFSWVKGVVAYSEIVRKVNSSESVLHPAEKRPKIVIKRKRRVKKAVVRKTLLPEYDSVSQEKEVSTNTD